MAGITASKEMSRDGETKTDTFTAAGSLARVKVRPHQTHATPMNLSACIAP